MIIDVLFYIIGYLVQILVYILPDWSFYPQTFLDGIAFFGQKIATLNFFIFDIPQIMIILTTVLSFESFYYLVRRLVSVVNFFRGSGKLDI